MSAVVSSPGIVNFSWGKIEIKGGQTFRDARLYPGGAEEWDWNETGTSHSTGIQPADVEQLLEHGAKIIILSRGFDRNLQVSADTIRLLEEKSVTYHALQTEEAIKLYNQLRSEHPVGGLFHSTC
ncbi:MAG: Mth938-like domain-containing protein [Dehalococcoidia bacterium]